MPTEGAEKWYAVQTYARHEKAVTQRLQERGVEVFLPLVSEVHRWNDRKKVVQLPLFSCYAFAKVGANAAARLQILRVDGVLNLVGSRGEGTPISDHEIESIRILLQERLHWTHYPFLQIGQRVRIRSGSLSGMEGVLLAHTGERTLVISVNAIQRSLAVRVEGYEIEVA